MYALAMRQSRERGRGRERGREREREMGVGVIIFLERGRRRCKPLSQTERIHHCLAASPTRPYIFTDLHRQSGVP